MQYLRIIPIRALVISAIVVLHVLLLILFDRAMRGMPRAKNESVAYLVMVRNQKAPPVQSVASEPRDPVVRGSAMTVPEIPSISTSALSFEGSPEIDWHAAAENAAREFVKQHPEQLTLSKPEKVPSLFKNDDHAPENVRQSGGKIVQWLNSRCYLMIRDGELDSGPPYNGARIQKTCILPKSDGEMLDHLKPDYLKKPVEEICAKNMVVCNHSSSSSAP